MVICEYFFECYFNQSANYDELEYLIDEFLKKEKKETCIIFASEINKIIENRDWDLIKKIARDKGGRILSEQKVKDLMVRIEASFKS